MNAADGYSVNEDGQGSEQDLEEPCYGKPCSANEHCCPGSVCINVDGGKKFSFTLFCCNLFFPAKSPSFCLNWAKL